MIQANILTETNGAGRGLLVDAHTEAVALGKTRDDDVPKDTSQAEMFTFLCSLFCPFIDSYWLASMALFKLLPDALSEEEALVAHAQLLGDKTHFKPDPCIATNPNLNP